MVSVSKYLKDTEDTPLMYLYLVRRYKIFVSVATLDVGDYLESVSETNIADEVLRSMACVNKVLRVVVVRVHGLGALEKCSRIAKFLRLRGCQRLLGTHCRGGCSFGFLDFLFKRPFDAKIII